MMNLFYTTIILSFIPFIISLTLLYLNMFISLEIPIMNISSFNISLSMLLDWMSCLFLSTVMFISSMIMLFSMFYMPQKEHKQFSSILMTFITSMSLLILSDNSFFILLGWDGLGLSSYILVIYYQNFSSAASGTITIMSNRLGDIMILLSIAITTSSMNWNFSMNEEFSKLSLMMLLIAAISKSAQFPFSAWLPAAMAAPTPISALVHSSTLVTAGVYLLLRIMNSIHPSSMFILAMISSITMIYASLSANWEQDMKKIIALSTLSQIAMMMFAISMKSTSLAFFHLITHALFKSTMFLCAGILIHNSSYQDMRMMGLNMMNSPSTSTIMGVATLALMGIPFTSGFFSKDSIIEFLLSSKMNSILAITMIFSIGLTAAYSIRLINFSNKLLMKSKKEIIHHSNKTAIPSISLMAPFSIFLGSSMAWSSSPHQIFILPYTLKFSIPITLIMGLILGLSMNFKSKHFNKMGNPSISLWFSHILSTAPFPKFSKLMSISFKNDNSWQETYGPQGTFLLNKNSSSIPTHMMTSMMFILLILILSPLFVMYL
uniref:NADH-ubiquinone oxidoreductase chain 5 n=1 Tax=Argyroneta aquatica TaxID=375087 RepID=A0A0E3DRF0_ARGAQ|nr:NADH dehydrogenase subunit 5 [Argyroneta aquatica]AIL95161.1 NADH dehydrogenase subunit 5 [Argyroneta aquatica]